MALVNAVRHPLRFRTTCFSCTIRGAHEVEFLPSVRIGRRLREHNRLTPPPWPCSARLFSTFPKLEQTRQSKKDICRGAAIARAATKTAQKTETAETAKEDAGCLTEDDEAEPQDGNGASLQVEDVELPPENDSDTAAVSFTVVGATGHLATQEIFPALFALYYKGCLPKNFFIFGYARSESNDKQFRELILTNLNCRLSAGTKCPQQMDSFLKRCFYEQGYYDTCTGMAKLDKRMKQLEGERVGNRVFYLSVPPDVVVDVATCLSVTAPSRTGWTRVIVEKPFGASGDSSKAITQGLQEALSEEQIYRIDHFLGKELIDNLTVLRFANLIFEPLWCRDYIKNVQIVFTEDSGVDARGKHLNQYGIIRDIVQSHVLQVLALFAMEQPVSLSAEDIRDEKVKVLKSLRRPTLDEVALGQYKARTNKSGDILDPGYLDEPDVPANSLAPTFAAMAFYIDNARWDGVPFLVKTGQAMRNQRNEIRIQFKGVPGNLYREHLGYNTEQQANELVIRVQPDEAIYLTINNKVPGLGVKLDQSRLNLLYRQEYNNDDIPDSYERLLLDVINGDKRLFIRADELAAAWEVLDPVLREIDDRGMVPELYTYGSRGPIGAYYLAAKQGGVRWADLDDL